MSNQSPLIPQIEALLYKYRRSYRWLAEKLGGKITHVSVTSWLDPNGAAPRNRAIYQQMLDILRTEGPDPDVKVSRGGSRFVPVYLAGIPAGPPSAGDASVEFEEVLDWGGEFERWGRPVRGESMSPILEQGDIAIFEDSKYEMGDVVHAFKDGEDMVKCIRGTEGQPMFYSFNEEYPPVPATGWTIKGRCVTRIRYGRHKIRTVTEFPNALHWSMRNEAF